MGSRACVAGQEFRQSEGRGDDSIPEYLIVNERCIGYWKLSPPGAGAGILWMLVPHP
jgi:hypothetical protein